MSTRIMIVDDHEIVREGLRSTLGSDPRFRVVAASASGAEALSAARRVDPQIAVIDLRLPDMSGVVLCRRLRESQPAISVVILSTYLSEDVVRQALDSGAAAYVTKAAGLETLLETLAHLASDSTAGDVPQASLIVKELHAIAGRRMGGIRTTPQQERVLELAAQGLTNRKIGERLFISESTVRFHIQKLKETLQARTKTERIAKAIRQGTIAPAPEDLGHVR